MCNITQFGTNHEHKKLENKLSGLDSLNYSFHNVFPKNPISKSVAVLNVDIFFFHLGVLVKFIPNLDIVASS